MDFRVLAESIPHMVWSTGADGNTDYQNSRFLKYIGRTLEEIQGWSWLDIMHPDDRQRTIAAWSEALAEGVEYCIEHRIRRAVDGCFLWHESRAAPLRDESGRIVRWVGTSTDIEERKRTAEELTRNRNVLQMLFDNTGDGLYVKDLAGRYLMANPVALKMLGKDAAEVIGQDDTAFPSGKMLDLVMGSDDKILETGAIVQRETPVLMPAGDILIMNVTKGPLRDGTGKIIGVFGVSRDVTTYKKAEQMLRDSEKQLTAIVAQRTADLEASNQKLRDLAERIESIAETERQSIGQEVHDQLGQLLTALKLNLSWLSRHVAQNSHQITERFADTEKIIDLALSSVHRITRNLRPRILDELGISAAIQAQLNGYRAQGLHCQLRVIGVEPALDPALTLSLYRIYQEGMTNILRHAGASHARIILRFDDEQVCLRIADNGHGITGEQINNAHSLGIVGMRERVLRWGGRFNISGRPKGGTLLDIEIPFGADAARGKSSNTCNDRHKPSSAS